ncbi:MAG: 2-hydroxyacyl-CoA dehydratase family protein [Evtepia sp.]|uniref:2-hydroxyacyl-CoA dehydratase subunit D n=1 Tax=Evtepia sp. TaxID=2773933 RepID=UPI002A7592B1|nr:2-hydroxyacyl-CoA dehydratase family protein [Evtepia sp.]MDY3014942.1 2-hydroxyacyl-CoA dehydratase family protein [Evtepia sp.]
MNLIETFGAQVSALSASNPARARRLLTTGFRANGWKNRLFHGKTTPSERTLFQLVNQSMITCLARPEDNVMVSLFTPCELLHIQGLHPYSCEGFSSYLSGSMVEQGFLRQAEETGIPSSLCSYHKVFIGAAQKNLMPKPRFILSTTLACDANMLTFRHLAEFYDVPHFSVDVPFESSPQAVDYVAGQLRQMGEFLTRQTGIPVDESRLAASVARSQRTLENYKTFLTQRAGKQMLSDLTGELYRTAAFHFLLGTEGTERYTRQLLQEVTQAPPAAGKQLLWIHTTPYWVLPLRQLFAQNPRVQIAACDMNYEGITEADPNRPYEAMAKRLVYSSFNGPAQRRIDRALEVARQTKADGAIWFCHWGCKHTLGGARLGKKTLEEAGIPTLILDGDSCDRGFGGEGQAATRVEAFLEVLEAMA